MRGPRGADGKNVFLSGTAIGELNTFCKANCYFKTAHLNSKEEQNGLEIKSSPLNRIT